MKKIWCPETAEKAYLDTIKSCGQNCTEDLNSGAPEFISATAGGWKAKLIVEARSNNIGGAAVVNVSVGLAITASHTGGRHVCIVPNEKAGKEYICAVQSRRSGSYPLPEVMVGEAEEVMERLNGVDFLVVDGSAGREDYCGRVFRHAKFSHMGAVVVVCQNAAGAGNYKKIPAFSPGLRSNMNDCGAISVLRRRFLPLGNGLEVAYVGLGGEKVTSCRKSTSGPKGWIRHVDQKSGEEHVYRR